MATFLLVHGAWHDKHCWDLLTESLLARGHAVAAPTLPGHGTEKKSPFLVTMKVYGERVCAVAQSLREPVICVGHSMGGYVMSQAAEMRPELFGKLVYLTAMVPDGSASLMAMGRRDHEAILGRGVVMKPLRGVAEFRRDQSREVFYNDCSDDLVSRAQAHLHPQPIRAFLSSVPMTAERCGSVPKAYIECTQDRAISLTAQRALQAHAEFKQVVTLEASHSPFLSMPERLAEVLEELAA